MLSVNLRPICLALCCIGCSSSSVSMMSGAYSIVDSASLEPLAEFENMLIEIDLDNNGLTMSWPDENQPAFVTTLEAVDESDWMQACPTNFSSTLLETWTVTDAMTIGETVLEEPFIFADGCQGNTTSELVWISSVAHENASMEIGTGLFYLKLNSTP